MTDDPFSKSAKALQEGSKAVQEIAKTTNAGIAATEKLGGFVSRIIDEPLVMVMGILTDKLSYMRWERRLRLVERSKELIADRNIEGPLNTVPPKIALPIVEHASLEENDELQDLWACLIASAVDPSFKGQIRAAYIEILRDLEVNDVHILEYIFRRYNADNHSYNEFVSSDHRDYYELDPLGAPTSMDSIVAEAPMEQGAYKESIDNLIRVGCVSFCIGRRKLEVPVKTQRLRNASLSGTGSRATLSGNLQTDTSYTPVIYSYDKICITRLGIGFARACINEKRLPDDENLSKPR